MQRNAVLTVLTVVLAAVTVAAMTVLVVLPVLDVFGGSDVNYDLTDKIARLARAGTVFLAGVLIVISVVSLLVSGPQNFVAQLGYAGVVVMCLPTWIFVFAGVEVPPAYHDELRSVGVQPDMIGAIYFLGTFVAIALTFGVARMLLENAKRAGLLRPPRSRTASGAR